MVLNMLAEMVEKHYEIHYELTSKVKAIGEESNVRVWGILGLCSEPMHSNIIHMIHFEDVSDCCGVAVNIIELLRENNVCLVQMEEIIEDYLIECPTN
ncbi:MAG TPA: hypothetical protein GX401_07200 [Clostridiales bacterium]|nr:hypothetical protein [Clostridiales bacterium]